MEEIESVLEIVLVVEHVSKFLPLLFGLDSFPVVTHEVIDFLGSICDSVLEGVADPSEEVEFLKIRMLVSEGKESLSHSFDNLLFLISPVSGSQVSCDKFCGFVLLNGICSFPPSEGGFSQNFLRAGFWDSEEFPHKSKLFVVVDVVFELLENVSLKVMDSRVKAHPVFHEFDSRKSESGLF